jgi:ribosomal-protein-alanine N-acetyltransferase
MFRSVTPCGGDYWEGVSLMIKHKGTKTLYTDRLILRRFTLEDATDMFVNWASDPEVTKYLSWLPHKDIEVTKNIISSWISSYDQLSNYNWAIVLKNYGKVIGSISVVGSMEKNLRCEVGYCLSRQYWNQGIMTEALKAVISYLIKEIGFKRVQAVHQVDNVASGRVMIKAGMKYEGRLRGFVLNNRNELVDCEMYAVLENDIKKL